MGRAAASVFVVLALIVMAEHRLSDGQPRWVSNPPPEIWDSVDHSSSVMHAPPAATCPLLLSLDPRSPYTLTSVDEGVRFDIDADGDLDRVAWTPRGSDVAFLAIDQDGDGRISSGRELITRHTRGTPASSANALIVLANDASGGERRGVIDTRHPLFPRLLLWTDVNHNGISEPSELRPAPQALSNIGLGFERHHRGDRHGNESRYRGFVHVRPDQTTVRARALDDESSRRRWMYDVCLITH